MEGDSMKKNRRMQASAFICRGAVTPLLIFAFASRILVHAQTGGSGEPQVITSGRPLDLAADLLQGRYGKPVTYEDPIWMWGGDVEPNARGNALWPRDRSFSLPVETRLDQAQIDDAALLGKVLQAYHQQTDGPVFRIAQSRWGLHILPAQARNGAGQFVSVKSMLDAHIDVPVANRTPFGHFQAICAAVTDSVGIKLEPFSPSLNRLFAPNGIRPPKVLTDKDEEQISFAWGATGLIAREAVISLLDQSSTTLTWKVLCQAGEVSCVFSLMPIQLTVVGAGREMIKKSLSYDRCVKCPQLPK